MNELGNVEGVRGNILVVRGEEQKHGRLCVATKRHA
jgi:hypothetical protein